MRISLARLALASVLLTAVPLFAPGCVMSDAAAPDLVETNADIGSTDARVDLPPPDLKGDDSGRDLNILDLTAPDLTSVDLAPPDGTATDGPAEDLSLPDLTAEDVEGPDLAVVDEAAADLAVADVAEPDLAAEDLAAGDLATEDLAPVCDPDGVYAIIMGGPVSYSCCLGLISINVSSFVFSGSGTTVYSSPSNPVAMSGAATTCPVGSFSNTGTIPGGCAVTSALQGSYVGTDTWTGSYTLRFSGPDCSCFGGLLGVPCVDQTYPITAMR